jgi:hypothetical protein
MSSFWTPSGEHRVPPTDDDLDGPTADLPPDFGADGEIDPAAAAAMEERLREAQEQLLSVPAAQIVANHLIGLFELAALHLRVDPPNLEEARLPIDAMGLVVDNMGPLLPDHATLAAALQQIRMAYVELHNELRGDEDDEFDEDAEDDDGEE